MIYVRQDKVYLRRVRPPQRTTHGSDYGLGNCTSYMKHLVEGTEGAFYPASDAEQLTDIYADISQRMDIETDGDGLSDCEEVLYYGTSALLPDTDRDGLNDKEEIENWFNPRNPDEDGDNRLDRQEFDEGTNPYVYDKDWKEQREDFFWGFADGLVRGDYIKDLESFAVVAGQITSGFVPYIEIRDILGNLHHNDFAFAGINLMGLLSFSGDTAKLTGRVTKFIVSNMDNLPEIGKLFGFMAKNCPEIMKTLCKDEEVVKALKQAVDTDTAKLTKKEAQALENTLREVGVDVTIKRGTKHNPWDIYTNQIIENSINVSGWNKGSFDTVAESVARHYYKHADEVGASSIEQYIRKAEGFRLNLKGATKSYVDGAVDGVVRYKKNGKFIDLAPDGTIISFGAN